MAATRVIRITPQDHERLQRLTTQTSMKQHEVITRALDTFEREFLLDSINAAFGALQSNPAAWREELEERAAWDRASAEGGGES